MRIGVIGVGVVGSATLLSFHSKFQESEDEADGYDKYKKIGSMRKILDTNIVFLCLPTLYEPKMGQYDKTEINNICKQLEHEGYTGLVVLKSTVEPGTTEKLSKTYQLNFAYNPEFLTARTAFQDVHEQKHIVIGSTKSCNPKLTEDLVNLYQRYYPEAVQSILTSTEAEVTKITCNNFYSVKIQFMNEIYSMCQKIGADYQKCLGAMLKNGWINPMHTHVPGTDGQMGYGGACFPKDTNALLSYLKTLDLPHGILQATVDERNAVRDD
jgi:nucleotide sugar dehydrogenase